MPIINAVTIDLSIDTDRPDSADQDSNGRKIPSCSTTKKENISSQKKLKLNEKDLCDDDDNIEIVDNEDIRKLKEDSTTRISPSPNNSKKSDDEEIQMIAVANEVKLPHMRSHCPEYKFDVKLGISNAKYCDQCFCYICDVPVSECKDWYDEKSSSHAEPWHYNANDKDKYWAERRALARNINDNSKGSNRFDKSESDESDFLTCSSEGSCGRDNYDSFFGQNSTNYSHYHRNKPNF